MSKKWCTCASISTEIRPNLVNVLHQKTALLGENKLNQPTRIVTESVSKFER